MSILETASNEDISRLLGLFPRTQLREEWSDLPSPTKAGLAGAVAEKRGRQQVSGFLDRRFSCCRQHVYVFDCPEKPKPFPASIDGLKRVHLALDGKHALYLARITHKVVLRNPLEESSIDFLWPVRLDSMRPHLVVRFVVLEKDLQAHFNRPCTLVERGTDEADFLDQIASEFDVTRADIHKGIKALWQAGFMDASQAKYKKSKSVAWEAMDEEKGIRDNDSELYNQLQKASLRNVLFKIAPNRHLTVVTLQADPGEGRLAFLRYSEKVGDTDCVVREILKNN